MASTAACSGATSRSTASAAISRRSFPATRRSRPISDPRRRPSCSTTTRCGSTMSAEPSVGYVGVGLMGGSMVERLVTLGYRVQAFDTDAARLAAARRAGAGCVESPAGAARGADFVMLNLPSAQAVEEAVFGTIGLATALRPPQLVVDFSTVPAAEGRHFSHWLPEKTGCNWVDAPVSGGPPASAAGTLTIMAGGAEADISRLKPL